MCCVTYPTLPPCLLELFEFAVVIDDLIKRESRRSLQCSADYILICRYKSEVGLVLVVVDRGLKLRGVVGCMKKLPCDCPLSCPTTRGAKLDNAGVAESAK